MVQYKIGNIFDQPLNSLNNLVIAHSANCQGKWGAGFALQLARNPRYAKEHSVYVAHCREALSRGMDISGTYLYSGEILNLFASFGYGNNKDTPEKILSNTEKALEAFMSGYIRANIHMPKINSGLFGVDWHKTEEILNALLEKYSTHTITVWSIA